jgi:hypothetical protein
MTAFALGSVVVGASSASPRRPGPASVSSAPTPATTINAELVSRLHGTRRPGTLVSSADLGQRVFADASHGFALAGIGGEGTYPAASVNRGRTWRIDGPILHINAAQAPLAVSHVGAGNAQTYFAWGAQVADATSDGGKHWWRALLGEDVLAVVSEAGRLIAVVQNPESSESATAATYVYVSTDGGRVWRYSNRIGGI